MARPKKEKKTEAEVMDAQDWDAHCRRTAAVLSIRSGPWYVTPERPWTEPEAKRIAQLKKLSQRKKKFTREDYPDLINEVADLDSGFWEPNRKYKQTFNEHFYGKA